MSTETDFKIDDCVQLKHGENPKMNVIDVANAIGGIDVTCIWFEKGKNQWRTFKAHVLKHCADKEDDELKGVKSLSQFIKEKNKNEES